MGTVLFGGSAWPVCLCVRVRVRVHVCEGQEWGEQRALVRWMDGWMDKDILDRYRQILYIYKLF